MNMLPMKQNRDYHLSRKIAKALRFKGDAIRTLTVFILLAQLSCVTCLTAIEKGRIDRGLLMGKGIADLLGSKEFTESLTKIGKSIGPYLGVFGPLIGLVLGFIPTDSAVIAELKRMMVRIDSSFDKMDFRFNDIEREIYWIPDKLKLDQVEEKILAISKECDYMFSVHKSATANRKTIFVNNYEKHYESSGYTLYSAIVYKNLGQSVMRYTKNDRNQTQIFLFGAMQLLIQAAKIELVYYQVKNFTANGEIMKNEWEKRIQEVAENFKRIDQDVKNKFNSQYIYDTKNYAAVFTSDTNKKFAERLGKLLVKKYYWRHWMVFAYNPIKGWEKHTLSTGSRYVGCDGDTFLRQNGRNIWVQSCEENLAKLDKSGAALYMNGIEEKKGYFRPRIRKAVDIYNSLDRDDYKPCGVAVIRRHNGLAGYGHVHRLAYVVGDYFEFIMWG